MTKHFFIFFLATIFAQLLLAQPVRLKLSRQINVPSYNHFAPSLSADGLNLLFASDYYMSNGNKSELKICQAKGMDYWGPVEEITTINKSGNLNQHGGHCLSADGNTIYFSSRKAGGVAGFDIWACEKKNGVWGTPYNLGRPINSEGMEGFPSLSPDGKSLYFVRCQTMDNKSCEGCKVYWSEAKGKGLWKEPLALPSSINQGNILFPRILKDNKTLLFGSDRAGGKGGYDLYITRREGTTWSEPQNLSVLNTADDEIFADMSIQTDAITYASFSEGFWTLYKAKLPTGFQPEPVLLLTGKVTSSESKPVTSSLQVSENNSLAPLLFSTTGLDGKFAVVLPKGKEYDFALVPASTHFFWSSTYSSLDLTKSKKEDMEIQLERFVEGKVYHGNKALFDSTTYQLLKGASLECRRIAKFLQGHSAVSVEFLLFPEGVTINKPTDQSGKYETMKAAFTVELLKAGLAADQILMTNGAGSAEEGDNYSGWALRLR